MKNIVNTLKSSIVLKNNGKNCKLFVEVNEFLSKLISKYNVQLAFLNCMRHVDNTIIVYIGGIQNANKPVVF